MRTRANLSHVHLFCHSILLLSDVFEFSVHLLRVWCFYIVQGSAEVNIQTLLCMGYIDAGKELVIYM